MSAADVQARQPCGTQRLSDRQGIANGRERRSSHPPHRALLGQPGYNVGVILQSAGVDHRQFRKRRGRHDKLGGSEPMRTTSATASRSASANWSQQIGWKPARSAENAAARVAAPTSKSGSAGGTEVVGAEIIDGPESAGSDQ